MSDTERSDEMAVSYTYEVTGIKSMYDGDSINVEVIRSHTLGGRIMDFGFGDVIHIPEYTVTKDMVVAVRMHGFDTPELRDKRANFKAAAYLAKEKARDWMDGALEGGRLFMYTYKDKTGKFGRYLANFHNLKDDSTLKGYLIDNQLAVPYHGQNKAEIEALHLANIEVLKERGEI